MTLKDRLLGAMYEYLEDAGMTKEEFAEIIRKMDLEDEPGEAEAVLDNKLSPCPGLIAAAEVVFELSEARVKELLYMMYEDGRDWVERGVAA